MNNGLLLGALTAASTGLGCGSCCGSGVSVFLFGYLTTHTRTPRQAFRAFCSFYLGKILAVAGVCVLSSLLGQRILNENGTIGFLNVRLLADLFMIGMGLLFIIRWFREKKQGACAACGHCETLSGHKGPGIRERRRSRQTSHCKMPAGHESPEAFPARTPPGRLALFGIGAGYGASPCAPLLLIAGYAATAGPAAALVTGGVFGLFSALVPMLAVLFLSGLLSPRLHREIPEYLDYFRLLVYFSLVLIFIADIL